MKKIYKRIIGLLMALPGLSLLYLGYIETILGVTLEKIVVLIISTFISIVTVILFFFGAWLMTGPED